MRFLRSFLGLFPTRELDGVTRYYLTWKENGYFNVFVHQIYPDKRQDVYHNHPWRASASFVLKGSYIERLYVDGELDTRVRVPLSIAVMTQKQFHRVALAAPATWTLYVTFGRDTSAWGYVDGDGNFTKK